MWSSKPSVSAAIYALLTAVVATKTTSYDANFEGLPSIPGANTINVYDGLLYKSFGASARNTGLGGVVPHSPPNVAVTTFTTQQATQGTPTLTVDYPNSRALSFDFFSFYFGCVAPAAQGQVGLAVQCSILVAGFNSANKEIAVATFTFTPPPTNLVNAPLIQAKLPSSFVGLHNVTIIQSSPVTQVLAVDDLLYNVKSTS